jgi:hypothetical protein
VCPGGAKPNSTPARTFGATHFGIGCSRHLDHFAQTLVTQGKRSLTQQDMNVPMNCGRLRKASAGRGALITTMIQCTQTTYRSRRNGEITPRTTRSRTQQAEALKEVCLSHKRLERQVEVTNLQPWATLANSRTGPLGQLAILNGVPYVLGSNRTVAELAEGGSIKAFPFQLNWASRLVSNPAGRHATYAWHKWSASSCEHSH